MDKIAAQLLPCPFCGGEATICPPSQITNDWTVICQTKNCECHFRFPYWDTEYELIEQWNKRIPIISIPGVKELVKKAYRQGVKDRDFYRYDKPGRLVTEYMKTLKDKERG